MPRILACVSKLLACDNAPVNVTSNIFLIFLSEILSIPSRRRESSMITLGVNKSETDWSSTTVTAEPPAFRYGEEQSHHPLLIFNKNYNILLLE